MTKRNEIIVLLMAGLFVVLVWGLYINLIYWGSIDSSMDVCREHMNASTKICNFGGGLI